MSISISTQNTITRVALKLGFVRQGVHDEQVKENLSVAEKYESEKKERIRITEQHALEQLERIRVSEQHALEQLERIRMTRSFTDEQIERTRVTEQSTLEQQAHQITVSHRENEQSERLRVIKDYLDLMEDCLTGSIYEDPPMQIWDATKGFNAQTREYGWDWPSKAHTMIGRKRLHNFRQLTETVLMNDIRGDIIETGVWRGGACILARAVLRAYGDSTRKVWLADSFEGLPLPKENLYPADKADKFNEFKELAVSLDIVKNNFIKYGLLDDKVDFIVGWFDKTLPVCEIENISVLRLDGDMYESTIIALDNLYSKVTPGGYVIVDDYHVVKGCKQAIHDFLDREKIHPIFTEIDGVGVFWQKN